MKTAQSFHREKLRNGKKGKTKLLIRKTMVENRESMP